MLHEFYYAALWLLAGSLALIADMPVFTAALVILCVVVIGAGSAATTS